MVEMDDVFPDQVLNALCGVCGLAFQDHPVKTDSDRIHYFHWGSGFSSFGCISYGSTAIDPVTGEPLAPQQVGEDR